MSEMDIHKDFHAKNNLGHSHGHGHGHHHDLSGRKLLISSVLNVVITIAEIIGGILSGSLALLSDAIHNLGDTIAVLLAFFANKLSKKAANEKQTFGYKRAEILTALFNAVVLAVIIIFLFREAWFRFREPEPIKSLIMFVVACIGLVSNIIVALLLKNDSSENINVRAAYLHIVGDVISSVAVILGSVFIYFFKIYWLDPLLTVLIGIYILKEAYSILKESIEILMQATPRNIELAFIQKELEQLGEIDNIHHVHVWNLNDRQIHFECHADLSEDIHVSETTSVLHKIESLLKNKFGISHVTIQFEYYCCDEKQLIHSKKT
jgi:cobalt-zinc-cadmium efflux system protein